MSSTNRMLVVTPDGAPASSLAAALAAAGWSVSCEPTLALGLASLEREPATALALSAAAAAADHDTAAHLDAVLHGLGVVPVLLVTGPPTAVEQHLAFRIGCAGMLDAGAPRDLREVLDTIAVRQRRRGLQRDEARRHEQLVGELRRRSAEQAERSQEQQDTYFLDLSRLMTIITNIMDGIVFVDRAGNVTLLNPVAEDLLGAKSFVALGRPLQALQGRPELVGALLRDHQRVQGQKEIAQTVEVHHSEQDLVYIKCRTVQVFDYRGQPAGVLSTLEDITAEFKTDQLKNQYLSIVAHELRTPLTGIKTFSTMMGKGALGPLNEQQMRVCESMREQSLRLEHQIDKLINLGSLESLDYGQDREAVRVADLVAGMLAPFEQPARDRRIELSLSAPEPDARIHIDRADMRRACQALIENAVKFSGDGGSVEVSITRDSAGALRFAVRDHGIGIDPRYHRRIFEKFFQVEDPLTRHHGGAGLGLFVAKGIVEAHGSRIEVSSQLGSGADFSFVLPVREPVPDSVGSPALA